MSVTSILAGIFWFGLGGALYAYLGFPALVSWLAWWRRRETPFVQGNTPPTDVVTVVIPAHNEERSLETKIRNVLDSDYPRALLDVIVVSDASTDGTNEIARSFEPDGIRLVVQETRQGKTAGLNRAMALARGSIVVFTDANAAYLPVMIGTLARYFLQPDVGLVTGYTRYTLTDNGLVAEATNLYTSLERAIKRAEGRWGCCVGADGAIFAMRRSLYGTLRTDDINDFVLPLRVIEQGYRCVFADDVFCSEQPGKSVESEFRRQSRITNRTLRAIWRNIHLLNPLRFPVFSFFLLSHKVVRFLVPVFLLLSASSLPFLVQTNGLYLVAGLGGLASVALVALSSGRRGFHILRVFLTMNAAVLDGWWKFLSGHGDVTWQHDRSGA